MSLTVGSLFSGIGGFDIGLERAGYDIAWQVENNDYCRRVLAKHWPHVTRYGDITAIDWATVPRVDILCGGFPCQPVSLCGQRRAQNDKRWLWPEFLRCIRLLRPRYIIIENVPGLFTAGFEDVLRGLANSGYDAEWSTLSACTFGAPHPRQRVFIVAYSIGTISQSRLPWRTVAKFATHRNGTENETWNSRNEQTAIASALSGIPHGIPDRVHRLRGLGNAIVPQIAEALGQMIMAAHAKERR